MSTTRRSQVIPDAGPYLERTGAGDALFLFLRAHRVVFDRVDREFREKQGLSLALWEVLVILSSTPEKRLRMADVTGRMLVSKSNVTQLIDKLERSGLVVREPDASDRRLIYAALTPKGIEAVRRGGDIFNAAAREHFAQHMTATEVHKVASGLSKVISAQVDGLRGVAAAPARSRGSGASSDDISDSQPPSAE